MKNENQNIIKEINLNLVRNALKHEKIASKPALAKLTGLSVVTINSLLNTLIDTKEVIKDMVLPSNGGRPATSFKFNSEFSLALLIYMHEENGIDTIFINVSNLYGEIIEKMKIYIKEFKLDNFNLLIEKIILKYPSIKIIAFGIPGLEVNGKLFVDYKELNNQPLLENIRKKFNLPVIFENDINAIIYGYAYLKKIEDDKCIIGIYIPEKYRPGAGIYFNGKLYKGRDGLAGEISNLPLDINWDEFDFNENDVNKIIIKIILSFNCMYNPDISVLYGKDIKESIKDDRTNKCNSEVQKAMIPEIIISKEINSNFEIGIKQIALKYLEPKLTIKK